MKAKIIATALFAFTAATVTFLPTLRTSGAVVNPQDPPPPKGQIGPTVNTSPRIDVVFVLDTTSSMSPFIQAAKEKIWSIASTMATAQHAPVIRMGLVAYRDRGDAYVTRAVDLSEDLDSVYAKLMDFRAQGGGDGPESVNQALHEAVQSLSWSQDQNTYKVVFLVGDAPSHMDYANDVHYPETLRVARERGIVINAIQCGQDQNTTRDWRQIANFGGGDYFQVEQSGSAIALATPYDAKLAELSAELDSTRLYYGTEDDKASKQRKVEATEKLRAEASVASLARRAAFNASASGERNRYGDGELVEDIASGRVDLDTIESEALPAPLQTMAPAEQAALIGRTAKRRASLERQIEEAAEKRDAYLREHVATDDDAKESLDHKLYDAVRAQARGKGIVYEAEAPRY